MSTITEDYVSFETAKLLKKKGFNPLECGMYYSLTTGKKTTELLTSLIACPTLQMAKKWLREVHNIDICAFPYQADYILYSYNVKIYKDKEIHLTITDSKTYEQACETAIKYCLEHLI